MALFNLREHGVGIVISTLIRTWTNNILPTFVCQDCPYQLFCHAPAALIYVYISGLLLYAQE